MTNNEIKLLYLQGVSCKGISDKCELSYSTIRRRLISIGCLRSHADAIRLSFKLGNRKPSTEWKQRQPHSIETRAKMSKSRLKLDLGSGSMKKQSGYIEITKGVNTGMLQHRVLMERHIGRKILSNEVVHHIDGNRSNNTMSNLELMTRSDHARHHALENYSNRVINKSNGRFV